MKKISVIVPVYNVELYISNTIKSLLSQSYKNFELIVVDDGSLDKSAEIAESLLSMSNVDYSIIHTKNRGVSSARNTGMEHACGEYIIMVDGDDVLASDFLEVYARLLKKYPESDVYSTSFTIIHDKAVVEQPKLSSDIMLFTWRDAIVGFYNRNPRFLLPTLMLSNGFIKQNEIRFDENVRYSEDVQFIWRVLSYNKKDVIHSSYSGYKYILHPGSTMTASGVKKILTWCMGFEKLDNEIHFLLPEEIKDSFVPMSYFAMLHGVSKMLSYNSFKEVFQKADCASHLRFDGANVSQKFKLVSSITSVYPYIGYLIMKKF